MTSTDAERATQKYAACRQEFADAGTRLRAELREISASAGVVTDVSVRTKDVGEFARKILRKGYQSDPWNQVTDKLGARVMVERMSHVDVIVNAVVAFVGRNAPMQILSLTDLRVGANPREFDYQGVHLQLALADQLDDGEVIECELQVRTRAQDLWSATVSHRLLYKQVIELPYEVQRPPYRLLALVEVFDDEFDRAMTHAVGLPDFKVGALIEVAEREYLRHSVRLVGDPKLTAQIMPVLADVIDGDAAVYAQQLTDFMDPRDAGFRAVLAEYGPESGDEDFDYVLFGQPEIVILFERLTRVPNRLLARWQEAALPPRILDATANALAVQLPET